MGDAKATILEREMGLQAFFFLLAYRVSLQACFETGALSTRYMCACFPGHKSQMAWGQARMVWQSALPTCGTRRLSLLQIEEALMRSSQNVTLSNSNMNAGLARNSAHGDPCYALFWLGGSSSLSQVLLSSVDATQEGCVALPGTDGADGCLREACPGSP